ncbi:hypothetical protein EK556_13010 [Salmonella enterica]|nr:hypothetical protein [Salmonella enterica]
MMVMNELLQRIRRKYPGLLYRRPSESNIIATGKLAKKLIDNYGKEKGYFSIDLDLLALHYKVERDALAFSLFIRGCLFQKIEDAFMVGLTSNAIKDHNHEY